MWSYQGVRGLGSVSGLGGLGSDKDGGWVCEVGLGEGLGSGKAGGWVCEVGLGEGIGSGALPSIGLC